MPRITITDAHRHAYENDGFFLLPSVITDPELAMLREEAAASVQRCDAQMDAANVTVLGPNRKGSRYFESFAHDHSPRLKNFLFSDLFADICQPLLGDNAVLYWEQFVIKGPDQGMKFSWHQDSGYGMHALERPYLSCWCALDDMSEANGTVYLLPYNRAGTKQVVEHQRDPDLGDLVGYFGPDPGDPVLCPAGSIACFSSFCFHRSGFNTTPHFRRVLLAQFAHAPIQKRDRSGIAGRAIPLLQQGHHLPHPHAGV